MREAGNRVLLVPAGGRGEGIGHLERCIALALRAGERCGIATEFLDPRARSLLLQKASTGGIRVFEGADCGGSWDFVLMDKRRTSLEELRRFSRISAVVCLDEGGEARKTARYTIDAMPSLAIGCPPNAASLSFLGLPKRVRTGVAGRLRAVLVSFGGEDAADLSGTLLDRILLLDALKASTTTVVQGPLFKRTEWPKGVAVVRDAQLDAEFLCRFDLVFTHFGMTALRSAALGIPTVLFNPSRYHRALSRKMGIPEIGVRTVNEGALAGFLRNVGELERSLDAFERAAGTSETSGLWDHLSAMGKGTGCACPACGSEENPVTARFPLRTYYRCGKCGLVYLDSFSSEKKTYGASYFNEDYRRQYGKSYIEDFDAIHRAGHGRLSVILRLLGGRADGIAVDVGCAYGPFLCALKECGFSPVGVDVSPEAIEYVRKTLGLPAIVSGMETVTADMLPPGTVRVLTMWYVIEHLGNLDGALRRAGELLGHGGVFAFSTPNGAGISARKSLVSFLEESPGDHYAVLSPMRLRRMLRRYGFTLRVIRVTGHHPERFPHPLGTLARYGLLRRIMHAASVLFGLGDTFEAYAVKGKTT